MGRMGWLWFLIVSFGIALCGYIRVLVKLLYGSVCLCEVWFGLVVHALVWFGKALTID